MNDAKAKMPVTSQEFGKRLCEALGLQGRFVSRIVIECDMDKSLPHVYVKGLLANASVPGIVTLVENVTVSPDGEVNALPLAAEIP